MATPFTLYFAGVGTVVVALAGGFGGGILIAERLGGTGAVPEAGNSRIAKVMGEYQTPKRVKVPETTGVASTPEEPSKPEIVELPASTTSEPNAELSPSEHPKSMVGESAPTAPKTTRNVAIAPAPIAQHEPERAVAKVAPLAKPTASLQSSDKARRSPRAEPDSKRVKEVKRNKPDAPRTARVVSHGVNYVVQTADGRRASQSEIAELTAKLRARRAQSVEVVRSSTMSYQPEGRRGLFGIFAD